MVDRPFLFAIVDEKSGDVPLFAGKIMDPTGDLRASVPYVAHILNVSHMLQEVRARG